MICRAIRPVPNDIRQQGFAFAAAGGGNAVVLDIGRQEVFDMAVQENNVAAVAMAGGEAVLAVGRIDGVI
jgi:hypothetical protein